MSNVSLSDLNRAALGGKEEYGWIHILALLYCVVIGAFSVAAWLGAGEPFRAAICAGAQILSVVLAVLARRGLTGQMVWAGLASAAIAFGFSTWAAKGLEHAWASNGASIEQWQVWFLTASEPAIFLLAEHIKEGRETLRAAHEKAERETAEELARIRAKNDRPAGRFQPEVVEGGRSAGSRSVELADVSAIARAAVETTAAAAVSTGAAVALPVDAAGAQPLLPLESVAHSERTFESPTAYAIHLIQHEGVRHRNELSRRVGLDHSGRAKLSTYRASQLLDEYAPGWRESRAA